jgi:hypothetical protein
MAFDESPSINTGMHMSMGNVVRPHVVLLPSRARPTKSCYLDMESLKTGPHLSLLRDGFKNICVSQSIAVIWSVVRWYIAAIARTYYIQ